MLPRPDHVVIVVEENHSEQNILGSPDAPYMNALAAAGASFSEMYALARPSQPNYLNLFSGSDHGIDYNELPPDVPFSTPNLGASLRAAGFGFTGYADGMPSVGFTGEASDAYARKHNPWVNWQDDALPAPANTLPSSVNQPFTSFPTDLTALPTVSMVVPDQNHDMHDGTVAEADAWLQANLDGYRHWAESHNSLLIVTWDEDDFTPENHIPTFFVGPMVQGGSYAGHFDHYSLLRTIEDMYGLPHAGGATNATAMDVAFLPEPAAALVAGGAGASLLRRRRRQANQGSVRDCLQQLSFPRPRTFRKTQIKGERSTARAGP